MFAYLQLMRPHQWTKNLVCFAGVLFGMRLRETDAIILDLAVFAVFCAVASSLYIVNDILDRERDRNHPRKQHRPIASGRVSVAAAIALALVLAVVGLGGSCLLGAAVVSCIIVYAGIGLLYSAWLKHLVMLDVFVVAMGFVLRLLAGIYVLGDMPTAWIVLCTMFLALFLGFAKRRAELTANNGENDGAKRPVLDDYSVATLDSLLNSAATMTVITYALFTATSGKNPSLVVTVPIVYYAIMHYKMLLLHGRGGEEPEWILLRNRPIQLSIILWLALTLLILYTRVHLFR